MKELHYTKAAIKDLKNIPAKDRKAIREKLENYAAGGVEDVRRLKGAKDLHRLRHGDWRAIFKEDGMVVRVTVLKVAKRVKCTADEGQEGLVNNEK